MFCLSLAAAKTQTFSANLLANQTFIRPTPGATVCGVVSFGTFVTVSAGTSTYSYATQSFTVLTPGEVIIEVDAGATNISDPMLMIYNNSFNPLMPLEHFRVGDDDSGAGFMPRIACQNFFSPGTYIIVVTTYGSGAQSGVVNFNVGGATPVIILPSVTTSIATSITSGSAILGGTVNDDGGADVTERGVAWGTVNNPTAGTAMGNGLGSFGETISGLAPATTYYHRAYATNSVGTAYGPQHTFTTLSAPLNPTGISSTDLAICPGGNVELTALGAEGQVFWHTGGCGQDLFATGNPITVSPTENTTYFARNFKNDLFSSGCASINISISEQPLPPNISRIPDFDNICIGQALSINTISGNGGGNNAIDQYSFSTDGGLTWSDWSTVQPSFNAVIGNNLIRGHRITSAPGCNNSQMSFVGWDAFEQPSAPSLTRLPDIDVVCNNTLLTVEATPGSGGSGIIYDQYRFSTNNGITWSEWEATAPLFYGVEGTSIVQGRRVADGFGCFGAETSVAWQVLPPFQPPVASSNQIICWNSAPQVITATGASGGNGQGYSYIWQESSDGDTWYDIPNETTLSFNPGTLLATTFFRLKSTESSPLNCAYEVFSNIVSVKVQPEPNPGQLSITNGQASTICYNTLAPVILGSDEQAAAYIWEISTTGPTNGFVADPSQQGNSLNPGTLTQTTWFRRTALINLDGLTCYSLPSNTIEITVQHPVTEGSISGPSGVCKGNIPSLITNNASGLGSGTISYFWETSITGPSGGFAVVANQGQDNLQLGQLTIPTWIRRTTKATLNGVTCNSNPTSTLFIEVFEPIEMTNIEIQNVYCRLPQNGGAIYFDLTGGVAPPVSYLWSTGQNNSFLQGASVGLHSVLITDSNGCILETSFEIGLDDEDCILSIPQGFSPNSDGKNDLWEVRNILFLHPDNRVKVFNRQGTLVFEAEKYDDDWDGTPNRGNVLVGHNGKVPTGVYFYMIWFSPDAKPVSGQVFVSY